MGIERDYIMRQLMMLMDFIRKIAGFREKGQKAEAEEAIRYFYQYLEINPEIHNIPAESFLSHLVNDKKLTNDHLELIACVLKEQGELAEGREQQFTFFSKAFFLLEKVERESIVFSITRQQKLSELKNFLENYS